MCEHIPTIQQAPWHFTPCKGASQFMTEDTVFLTVFSFKTTPELSLVWDNITLIAGVISQGINSGGSAALI